MDDNLRNAVLGAADGNTADFGTVYSSTYAKTYALALKYSGTEKDALDIVQDAYVCVWANIRMLNKPEELFDWIENITALTAKNHGFKAEAFSVDPNSFSINRESYNSIFANAIKGISSAKSKRGVTQTPESQTPRSVFDRSVIPSDEAEQSAYKDNTQEYCERYSNNPDAAVLFDDNDDDDEPAGMSNGAKIAIAAVVIVVLIAASIAAVKLFGNGEENDTTEPTGSGMSIINTTFPTTSKNYSYVSNQDIEIPTEEPDSEDTTSSTSTSTTRRITTTAKRTTTTTRRHTTTKPTTSTTKPTTSTTKPTEHSSSDITNSTDVIPSESTTDKPVASSSISGDITEIAPPEQ